MRAEDLLQISVAKYLNLQYPNVIFTSDASGIVTSMGQALKMKRMRSDDKIPDLLVLEPRGRFGGLMIELKVKSPYLKDGKTLRKDEHLRLQNETLVNLRNKGYSAAFATGFDEAKEIIDDYLKIPKWQE